MWARQRAWVIPVAAIIFSAATSWCALGQGLGRPTGDAPPSAPQPAPVRPVPIPQAWKSAPTVDPLPLRPIGWPGASLPLQQVERNAAPSPNSHVRPVGHFEPALHDAIGPAWTLQQLVDLAAENHPDLASARARVQAAQGRVIQAGLYPNPVITYRDEDIGARGENNAALGSQQLRIDQEIVTKGKLRISEMAASFGVQAADWQTTTRWFDVLTRVRQAYFEALAAQRNEKAVRDIVAIATKSFDLAKTLEKNKIGSQLDVIRAQVELDQNRNRLVVAQRRLEAAWKLLAIAVGLPELHVRRLAGTLSEMVPNVTWEELLGQMLMRSSEIQEAQARVGEAEQLLRRAEADRYPNVTVSTIPLYSFPDQQARTHIYVLAPLPLFNRNQGNILSAQADLARTEADVKTVELRLGERLAGAYQRFQAGRQQADNFQKILKNARETVRLITIAWENGDKKYDYTALLQAQQVLFQSELDNVQVLGDMWRAFSEVWGLIQEEQMPIPSR
jgi:cobalt-zinc-cadmium efflux system outer membrane protein